MDTDLKVHHRSPWDRERGAFTVERGVDQLGTMTYRLEPGRLIIEDTLLAEDLQGHGAGSALARAAADYAREHHLALSAECPWASEHLARHPELTG